MFREGDRVLGRYQHKGKKGTVKKSCERYTHLLWDGGKRETRVLTSKLSPIGQGVGDGEV